MERLRLAAAAVQLDLVSPEVVIIAEAADILPDLPSNRPLAELAGASPSREVVSGVLSRALEVEGSHMPSDNEAGRIVARNISRAILGGKVSASEGAREIWWKVVRRVPSLEGELGHFAGLASEWEDDIAHRAEYEADIREAATEVANSS